MDIKIGHSKKYIQISDNTAPVGVGRLQPLAKNNPIHKLTKEKNNTLNELQTDLRLLIWYFSGRRFFRKMTGKSSKIQVPENIFLEKFKL